MRLGDICSGLAPVMPEMQTREAPSKVSEVSRFEGFCLEAMLHTVNADSRLLMQFDPTGAEAMGTWIRTPAHAPFRALACPLSLRAVRIIPASARHPAPNWLAPVKTIA